MTTRPLGKVLHSGLTATTLNEVMLVSSSGSRLLPQKSSRRFTKERRQLQALDCQPTSFVKRTVSSLHRSRLRLRNPILAAFSTFSKHVAGPRHIRWQSFLSVTDEQPLS